jgi:hypothetical protein
MVTNLHHTATILRRKQDMRLGGSLSLRERVGERGYEYKCIISPLPVPLPAGEGTSRYRIVHALHHSDSDKEAPNLFNLP